MDTPLSVFTTVAGVAKDVRVSGHMVRGGAVDNTNVAYSWEAVSTCKCTARKVKEYFRKNTQKGYENLIFLLGDGLFCQQLW